MKDALNEKWDTWIACPFCRRKIVEYYERPASDEDSDDAVSEYRTAKCLHVAYSGTWGLEDFSASEEWKPHIAIVCEALSKKAGVPYNERDSQQLAHLVYLDEQNRTHLARIMQPYLRDVDVRCAETTMETGDGPRGDGEAWFFYVFMRHKKDGLAKRRLS